MMGFGIPEALLAASAGPRLFDGQPRSRARERAVPSRVIGATTFRAKPYRLFGIGDQCVNAVSHGTPQPNDHGLSQNIEDHLSERWLLDLSVRNRRSLHPLRWIKLRRRNVVPRLSLWASKTPDRRQYNAPQPREPIIV
jgi:hypothetical protein